MDMNPIIWRLNDVWDFLLETLFWPIDSYKNYRMFKRIRDRVHARVFRDRVWIGLFAATLIVLGLLYRDELGPFVYVGLIFYIVGLMTRDSAFTVPLDWGSP